ncbi:hypothetical protein DFH08DRAFT_815173 [Mycena albidolilacea]|uniref:Uncharacterized protein n=1 Tax=Mycena albidolilacea TaxID=1033008 RepID=A0AAD6ZNV1_9AGAR|nr:hypothetical protein DFH08DRAFT_815173 [Mycena albidolilacea]
MSGRLIGLFSPSESLNVPKMPPVPSRTPAARRLACARYREKKKEELAEKSRIKMKEYRQRIQDDPVHAQEYQGRQKAVNDAYQQKNRRLLAYKKREIRLENATKKLGRDKARETACERQRNREQGRDYELELAILQAKHQDEIQMKVADARWSPGSSRGSRYQREDGSYSFRGAKCVEELSGTGGTPQKRPKELSRAPPFQSRDQKLAAIASSSSHLPDGPSYPNTTKATAKVFYLVTSPAAGSKRGVYPSWTSAQRASEGKARGGAVKFTAWDDCLPAWHACCDAGEHEHDTLPPRTPTPPTTPTRLPRAAPSSVPPSPTYAVRGSGTIHSSLDAALADFQAAATRGQRRSIPRRTLGSLHMSQLAAPLRMQLPLRVVEQLSEVLADLAVDPSEMVGGNVSYDHTVPLTGSPYENDDSDNEYWRDT